MSKANYKTFATDQEVRWCPGCGDYAVLKSVQKALATLSADPHKTVFVSGIGCAARLPYYVETFGFHTIHGRAPAIATGVKVANPELDVWVITGDGDGLSIGANHLLHTLRRNVDLNIILLNNEIYGLTKGQYSPTSRTGTRSPSSPEGSIEEPLNPCQLALAAGGTFIARGVDVDQKQLPPLFASANQHVGSAFVEVLQNCIIYNKDVFDDVVAKKAKATSQVQLTHGEPLIFGAEQELGLRMNPQSFALEAFEFGTNPEQVLRHDETNNTLAHLLVQMKPPLPVAMGIIFRTPKKTFETECRKNKNVSISTPFAKLLRAKNLTDNR